MSDPPEPPTARRRGYLVPGLIALAALVVIAVILDTTHRPDASPHRLDASETAARIAQGYQEDHHLASPPPVHCPNDEPVVAGRRFDCQLERGNGPLTVAVTETGGGDIIYRVLGAG